MTTSKGKVHRLEICRTWHFKFAARQMLGISQHVPLFVDGALQAQAFLFHEKKDPRIMDVTIQH